MRAAAVLVLVACGDHTVVTTTPPVATSATIDARPTAPPACTRTIAQKPLHPDSPWVRHIAWLDGGKIVVSVAEGQTWNRPFDPDSDHFGLLVYDLAKTYDAKDPPLRSFPLRTNDVAMRGDKTAIVVTPAGVGTFDLDTGCLVEVPLASELELHRQLTAIDTNKRRVFVVTGSQLVRVDLDFRTISHPVPAPSGVEAIAYDPTSDRLVVRASDTHVHVFDPVTLAETNTFELPRAPSGGPWIRPGHDEAAFSYEVTCEHRAPPPPGPPRMRAPPCVDPPKTLGVRVARMSLPAGALIATGEDIKNTSLSEPYGSWSGDGKRLVVVDPGDFYVADVDKPMAYVPLIDERKKPVDYNWKGGDAFPMPFVLDATGARYAGQRATYFIRVGDTRTGVDAWTAPLPSVYN